MKIDFEKIIANALSTLVAAVFVGAAAIVWQAATSVDDRIKEANDSIIQQQSALKATQETIVPKLTSIDMTIDELRAEIRSLSKLLAEANSLSDIAEFKAGKPIILEEFLVEKSPDWNKQESERINNQIDMRQMELYEQRVSPAY